VRANIVKNKIAPPFKKAEFDMLFASGISYEGDLLDLGEEQQVIERSGSWIAYKGEKIGQGRERGREFLKEHPEIAIKIENEIRIKMGLEPRTTPTPPKPEKAEEKEEREEKKTVKSSR
jgi:recombination protein RecA